MNKQTKIFVVLVAAAVIAVIVWAFTTGNKPNIKDIQPDAGTSNMTYSGNTLTEERDGKTVWKLNAKTIEIDNNAKVAKLNDINGEFYQEDGAVVKLVAGKAAYNMDTKQIVIEADVKAEKSDGTVMTMDKLSWDNNQQLANGDGNVRVQKEKTIVTGDKMESRDRFKQIKVMGHAHVVKGE